jgi:hypothetical protein
LDEPTAQATARVILDLADELEPMLVYAWRRHLNDAVSRLLADASSGARPRESCGASGSLIWWRSPPWSANSPNAI